MLAIGLVAGICVGVAATVLAVVLWPSRSWQEDSVRSQAERIGCNLSHGLGNPCFHFTRLVLGEGYGPWIVTFQVGRRHVCYEVLPNVEPWRRRPCA